MTLPLKPDSEGWFKTARSKDGADCVEVNLGPAVGVRDTKDRDGGQLRLPEGSWSAFLDGLKK
jgi:hypothetical protein